MSDSPNTLSITTAEAFASKFLAAEYDANGTIIKHVAPTIAAGKMFAGIAQAAYSSGDRATVKKFGHSKAIAGGTLTAGTHGPLMADSGAAGRLVPATAGNWIVAFWHADGDDKADGDEIDVFLPGGPIPYILDTTE